MGVGRFAYTPILPLMKSEASLSDAFAGILAAANYAGYLIGAFVASHRLWRARRGATILWSLGTVAVTTLAMGFFASGAAWLLLRFIAGIASAFVLILVSSVVLDRASRERRHAWPGALYAGVGTGIALTGIAVPVFATAGWRAAWVGMGALSLALCIPAAAWFRDSEEHHSGPDRGAGTESVDPRAYWTLILAYFGEGIGYIVPATFIVAIFRASPQLAPIASLAWIFVGLVAIPSALVWPRLAARFGSRPTLGCALILLAGGVAAPVYVHHVVAGAFAAFALGATFMGITAVVNMEARSLFPRSSNRAIGQLTGAFSFGQIVGPLIVTAAAASPGAYDRALIVAAVVLIASAASALAGISPSHEKPA